LKKWHRADVLVTYQGGPDASKVTKVSVIPYKADGAVLTGTDNVKGTAITGTNASTAANGTFWYNPEPGYTMTISGAGTSAQERVVVTAVFDDGSNQVLLDKQL
jgi:archaeal type IV pilus assembly protein PilA